MHAAIVQGVAKHGPFDTSIDFARYAWTGEFHVVRDPACEHGFRVVCADEFHIDKAALIEEILGAAIAIAITLAFPPLAMIAGFIGTILVAIALLALANMAADFVTSNCGVSPAEFQGRLDQLAGEARAA